MKTVHVRNLSQEGRSALIIVKQLLMTGKSKAAVIRWLLFFAVIAGVNAFLTPGFHYFFWKSLICCHSMSQHEVKFTVIIQLVCLIFQLMRYISLV